jgi:hypothetical protein
MTPPKVKIRDLTRALGEVNLGRLAANLERAVQIEADHGSTVPDGLTAAGDGGGGGSGTSDPTLATLLARVAAVKDRRRIYTTTALEALVAAHRAMMLCEQQLANLSDLEADRPITPKGCDLCTAAGLTENGEPVPWHAKGNVGGRLKVDRYLCEPHYDHIRKHWPQDGSDPEPTTESTRHYHTTGQWLKREKVAAK